MQVIILAANEADVDLQYLIKWGKINKIINTEIPMEFKYKLTLIRLEISSVKIQTPWKNSLPKR